MTGRLNWSAFRNSGCTAVYCLQKQTKETMGTKKGVIKSVGQN